MLTDILNVCTFWFWQRVLGIWHFKSKNRDTYYEGYMFPLLVEEQLEFWPEKDFRQRIWVRPNIALYFDPHTRNTKYPIHDQELLILDVDHRGACDNISICPKLCCHSFYFSFWAKNNFAF